MKTAALQVELANAKLAGGATDAALVMERSQNTRLKEQNDQAALAATQANQRIEALAAELAAGRKATLQATATATAGNAQTALAAQNGIRFPRAKSDRSDSAPETLHERQAPPSPPVMPTLATRKEAINAIVHGADKKLQALGYCRLGDLLRRRETITCSPKSGSLTKKNCYEEAIALDPTLDSAFSGLALTINGIEKRTLKSAITVMGQSKDQVDARDCCLKAIELNPLSSAAFDALGMCLDDDDLINISPAISVQGRLKSQLSRDDCFLHAVELDPTSASAFANLGITTDICWEREIIMQPPLYLKGKEISGFTRESCLEKALELDPNCATAYLHIGSSLKHYAKKMQLTLHGRTQRTSTDKDLFLKAIELDPDNAEAYGELGSNMGPDEFVTIRPGINSNGKLKGSVNRMDCLIRSVELGPASPLPFLALAVLLEGEKRVTFNCFIFSRGTVYSSFNRKDCLHRAIELHPKLALNNDVKSYFPDIPDLSNF